MVSACASGTALQEVASGLRNMNADYLPDENIGWPSFVDFLASFAFILILFVTWTTSLMTGAERERKVQAVLEKVKADFRAAGFEPVIEGHKLRIPLRNKVSFALNRSALDSTAIANLREAARKIVAHPEMRRVIVYGYADGVPASDPFFNWRLSVDRAMEVLRFLYMCTDCGYRPEDIRPRLVLRGDGDLDARRLSETEIRQGDPGDRRVDIILDKDETEGP